MTSKRAIESFLNNNSIAIVGGSHNKKKFGYAVYKHLKQWNYKTFPINPNVNEIDSDKCYAGLGKVDEKIDGVILVVPPNISEKVFK